jgi:hypothetical protein
MPTTSSHLRSVEVYIIIILYRSRIIQDKALSNSEAQLHEARSGIYQIENYVTFYKKPIATFYDITRLRGSASHKGEKSNACTHFDFVNANSLNPSRSIFTIK